MAILVVFVDGVGLGVDDASVNPLARFGMPRTAGLAGVAGLSEVHVGGRLLALDATLGVPGLPQSATGQTTLLTGVNAAQWLGKHRGPYAGAELRPLLEHETLWHDVVAAGGRATLANAYPDRYLARAHSGTGRMGAFARSAILAGVRLRGFTDLLKGEAVSAFITNQGWSDVLGYSDVPERSPEEAGRILGRLASEHELTIFDFYATDIAGHRQDWNAAEEWLDAVDRLTASAFELLPPGDSLLLVSDHGNLEDLSTGHHTLNPALGVWLGPAPWEREIAPQPTSLTHIAPCLRAMLDPVQPRPYPSDLSA